MSKDNEHIPENEREDYALEHRAEEDAWQREVDAMAEEIYGPDWASSTPWREKFRPAIEQAAKVDPFAHTHSVQTMPTLKETAAWAEEMAAYNAADAATTTHSPTPPPAKKETCAWHGKREVRADFPEERWLSVGDNEEDSFDPLNRAYEERHKQLAAQTIKRQLREWPECKFSGKPLELTWRNDDISLETFEAAYCAYWHCPHCAK